MAVLVAVMCLSSCGGIKKLEDIEITSAKIEKFSPKGFKAADIGFEIGIDNPGTQVTLSEIFCDVKLSGKVVVKVAVDPVVLQARTEETYSISANMTMQDEASVFDLGKLLLMAASDGLTADLRAKVKIKGGISKNLVYNDLPLKELIETATK